MEVEALGAPVRLLLVEDDEIDRETVRRLLGADFVVTAVATGRAALQEIAATPPDAVLLDFRLPDMEGIDLVPFCAQGFIPVILLTGEDSPEVIVQAMQNGAQDYLVKGHIGKTALARAIGNAIEKVALRRDLAYQQAQLAQQALALERSNRQVRALASALTLAEQRERRRISQILHDHVQQMLYGIQMRTYLIGLDTPEEGKAYIHEHLTEMEALVEEAIQSTRTLTVELSPPVLQSEGLGAAFSWLANQMNRLYDLRVDLEMAQDYQLASDDLRVLIFQLVRELLFNVVKHAFTSQARVIMCVEGEQFVVRVEDKGVGFDPLPLVDEATGDIGGFGLYSIRERLALFGGEVMIASQPEQGTQSSAFIAQRDCIESGRLRLTNLERNSHHNLCASLDVAHSKWNGLCIGGLVARVFIVEDHPVVRKGYVAFIRREPGLEVCGEATSAEEALALLPNANADVAVLDVSLPGGMSGIDLLRELKKLFPDLPILIVSGNEEAVYGDLVVGLGAWGYIMKGNAEAFIQAVRGMVAETIDAK